MNRELVRCFDTEVFIERRLLRPMADSKLQIANGEWQDKNNVYQTADAQSPAKGVCQITQQGGYGTSHVVRGHLFLRHCENTFSTAYRPDYPYVAFAEDMVRKGIVMKDGHAAVWMGQLNMSMMCFLMFCLCRC